MISQENARIHLVIPWEFLDEIDQAALDQTMSRSGFIRLALMEKIGRQQLIDQKQRDFLKSLDKYQQPLDDD